MRKRHAAKNVRPAALRPNHHAAIDLLTVHEVAELLRVTDMTIYRLSARGVLKPLKVGRQLRFDFHELARWLRASGGTE